MKPLSILGVSLVVSAGALTACGGTQQPEVQEPASASAASEQPVYQQTEPAEIAPHCEDVACVNSGVVSFEVDGIDVIVKELAHPPMVSARIYFNGGAAEWTPQSAGLERFALSAAASGGPEGMSKADYQSALDRVGAAVGTSSDRDYAFASLSTLSATLDETWDLFSSALLSPGYESEVLEVTRNQMLTSIATRFDDPDGAVRETVQELAWGDHPYGIHPGGEPDVVGAADAATLEQMLDALLIRERMTVVFVGDITPQQARALVERAFSDLPSSEGWADASIDDAYPPFDFDGGALSIFERPELPTNYIIGYFAAPAPGDADYPAAVIATQILRNRLFEEVRTRRNLTYAVSSGLGSRRSNVGYLYVTATDPETTLQVMYDTVDDIIDGNISEQDVENQVRTYLTRYFMGLQSFGAQANLLADWALLTGDRLGADRFVAELYALTPEDVSRVLETYVRDIQFGVVGDPAAIPEALFTSR